DIGEPFAVAAFAETVVPPEQDRAGRLLVEAAREYRLEAIAVTRRLGRPEATPALRSWALSPLGGRDDRARELRDSDSFWNWLTLYKLQLDEVSALGWPDRAVKLERWVEGVSEGGWARRLEALGGPDGKPRRGGYLEVGLDQYNYEIDGEALR